MRLRVIQWATGGVGRAAVHGVVSHPELESSSAAGSMAGRDRLLFLYTRNSEHPEQSPYLVDSRRLRPTRRSHPTNGANASPSMPISPHEAPPLSKAPTSQIA